MIEIRQQKSAPDVLEFNKLVKLCKRLNKLQDPEIGKFTMFNAGHIGKVIVLENEKTNSIDILEKIVNQLTLMGIGDFIRNYWFGDGLQLTGYVSIINEVETTLFISGRTEEERITKLKFIRSEIGRIYDLQRFSTQITKLI